MNTIDKKEVEHILGLAMLNCNDKEIEDYVNSLNQVIEEINKVQALEIENDEIMISPTNNKNCYAEFETAKMIEKEEILKHISNREGDYVLVPKVIE
ncbi:MAG: Asp-tRNA(Asn)/Glu-tRNA(Gln) amidotransferase subunit GatC [Bacilli bacterium]|nr:Asp-tRNA(Asn)/Glu-tRNA(Gln) amidotransferase subunit GatC [Bacilli bacterium]MDD4282564.1 Asp-tRNA(Asn)/Glu-tRNA(Gln) amidotransferase subunit GatC [Bacilli bacterium]MDD4718959.1 Asp-tRNA(Asn)/Glu-tRNA(Gln) amidotransferase subunit GatC [Bacilli bacterium]